MFIRIYLNGVAARFAKFKIKMPFPRIRRSRFFKGGLSDCGNIGLLLKWVGNEIF
ncbi:MAG: hypothetical protein K6B46_03790 [Opitutales bacterium]|nr:hypothetical protein [Opitutales bacterium]